MLVVIGCGNLARSDDGIGVEVVRRLIERFGAQDLELRLIDAGTAGMDGMYQVRGAVQVIIVDACRSGSEAGAVFRLPGNEAQTPAEPGFTQHGLRWDHALYAGGKMFGADFLRNIEVFLVEAQSLDFGIGLSAAVERGVQQVIAEISVLIRAREPAANAEVWLQNGRLHLTSAAYDRYMDSCSIAALLACDDAWLLLPFRVGAGGSQIKLRNTRGDRVIEAQEFFRAQGLEDSAQLRRVCLHHAPEQGAWRIELADSATPPVQAIA